MLEKFHEQQVELITNCAEAVQSIETYRINQKGINSLFGLSYLFTDPDDDWDEKTRGVKEAQEEYNKVSNYHRMIAMISEKFPEMNRAYLPFITGDLMKEAYEKKNSEVKENV
ncbi:MAG: hypothetical protein K2G83_00510 [Ruminococcus sp.]|nr:hypothetical protein [Ruminococcus sp.]